ncbi:RRP40 [Enterospora canceri]|uniref:RRP40 n=1 Tax=Enterospora canceri TaxID=1081671 RepID=A0A1Y1S3Z1_9MICR|nr:RRP40 [Enterospora canceri]
MEIDLFKKIEEFKFIRNVKAGDEIIEEGRRCMNILNNKATTDGKLYKVGRILFNFSKTIQYRPMVHDIVIGRVFVIQNDYYKVNVAHGNLHNSMYTGILPFLSFTNATKKNRPELNTGDLVLAKISGIFGNELQLTCNEMNLGQIDFVFQMDVWKVQLLHFMNLQEEIKSVSRKCKSYCLALGMNGYIYLESDEFIEIKQALEQCMNESN